MLGEVEESVRSRFHNSPYFALRDIGCTYQDRILTLCGRLPTYYLKQLAQSMVADLDGVADVVNQIEVVTPRDRTVVGRGEGR